MSLRAPARTASVNPTAGNTGRRYERILLASEGRAFSDEAIAQVLAIAAPGARVRVFSVARIHGVAFGMPNPGLLPTKREWADQRDAVASAIGRLKRRHVTADGHVVGTRNATKMILKEAAAHECQAIVMGADRDRNRVIANAIWEQEPQRVRRRPKLAVYLAFEQWPPRS
jgi:nucleotide-binding universal stress UspA family protein